jgi:hypothetical protein
MCSILRHRVYTYNVQGFLVNRQIRSPPPQASVSPPTFGSWGDTLACGGGGGGANSDEGTGNLVLYVYYNPSTLRTNIQYFCPNFSFCLVLKVELVNSVQTLNIKNTVYTVCNNI